jgi:hypothetical protein
MTMTSGCVAIAFDTAVKPSAAGDHVVSPNSKVERPYVEGVRVVIHEKNSRSHGQSLVDGYTHQGLYQAREWKTEPPEVEMA